MTQPNKHLAFRSSCLLGLLIPFVAILSLRPLGAQTVYGSIYGTVLDRSGAVIANASVEIKSQQKETSFKTQTNSVGQYRIDHLVPDTYDVTISAAGFKSFTVKSLQVNAGFTPKVDANLEVGGVDQSVTVNATVEELLKTETQDVTISIPQETVQELPLMGRSVNNLILLTPGAYAALGQMGVQALNPAAGSTYTVNGQPVGGVNYTLDGTDNTGPILGYIIINPAPNSVQEAKTITSTYNADTGRATSAVFATQTRSGTNSFHGLLSDVRTSAANLARDPYAAAQSPPGGPAPALSNQPEFNIGGPILKQRLFFFFDYFGLRQRQGSSVQTTLPTAHLEKTCLGLEPTSTGELGCDFGEYNAPPPAGYGDAGTIYDPSGTPYPNNIIPAAQLSQQALKLLAMLPPPNIPGSLYSNYSVNTISPINTDQFTTRIDGQLTSRMHLFGRWTYYRDDLIGHPVFGLAGGPTGSGLGEAGHGTGHTHSLSIGLDDAISNRLLMDLRFGYYYDHLTDDMANANHDLGTELGIPGLNDTGAPLSHGEPVFNISNTVGNQSIGATALGGAPSTPVRQKEDQFQLTNNWTLIMGTHTLKAGMDLRYGRENRQESFDSRTGNMTFGNGPTSNPTDGTGGLAWRANRIHARRGRFRGTQGSPKAYLLLRPGHVARYPEAHHQLRITLGDLLPGDGRRKGTRRIVESQYWNAPGRRLRPLRDEYGADHEFPQYWTASRIQLSARQQDGHSRRIRAQLRAGQLRIHLRPGPGGKPARVWDSEPFRNDTNRICVQSVGWSSGICVPDGSTEWVGPCSRRRDAHGPARARDGTSKSRLLEREFPACYHTDADSHGYLHWEQGYAFLSGQLDVRVPEQSASDSAGFAVV